MADTNDNLSLKDSVLNAFAESEKANGATPAGEAAVTTEEKVVEKQETKESEKTEETSEKVEEEVVEIDASADEIRSALALRRALRDPKTTQSTMEELAKISGYDLGKKADVKQLAKDAKTVLREKLGDSYDILGGDKLAEAFDALLGDRVKEVTEPALARIAEAEQAANVQKANDAMNALWVRNSITDIKIREDLAGRMLSKMKSMPAGEGTDISSYLDDMYTLVNRDVEKARTVKKVVTRIKENAKEVSRTSGEGGPDDERVKAGSKLPSVKEAVAAAFRGERLS